MINKAKHVLAFLCYNNGKYKSTWIDILIDCEKYKERKFEYFIVKLSNNDGAYGIDEDFYAIGVNGSNLDSCIECEQVTKHYAGEYFAIVKKEKLFNK